MSLKQLREAAIENSLSSQRFATAKMNSTLGNAAFFTIASDCKEVAESNCQWCGEDFGNKHFRIITNCCGFIIGDSCFDEAFEDDTCYSCSAARPAKSSSLSTESSETRTYITHFNNSRVPEPITNAPHLNGKKIDDQPYRTDEKQILNECLVQKDPLQSVHDCSDKPLIQASAESKESFKARTRLQEALETFLYLWDEDSDKLRKNDRTSLIEVARKALSDAKMIDHDEVPHSSSSSSPSRTSKHADLGHSSSTTAATTITNLSKNHATSSDYRYIASAMARSKSIENKYYNIEEYCEDCFHMSVRVAEALKPGPPGFWWPHESCHRCDYVREVVGDVVGATF